MFNITMEITMEVIINIIIEAITVKEIIQINQEEEKVERLQKNGKKDFEEKIREIPKVYGDRLSEKVFSQKNENEMHWRDYHALCNTIDVIKEELQEKEKEEVKK